MGYYSYYLLEAEGENEEAFYNDMQEDIVVLDNYSTLRDVVEYEDMAYNDSCKWYDFKEDMEKISKEYPNTLFTIYRSGEETSDMERVYFRNGKFEADIPQIRFAGPSERLLNNE